MALSAFRVATTFRQLAQKSSIKIVQRGLATPALTYNLSEHLLNVPPTDVTVLENGMKVATEDSGAQTATVGVWIDTGSKYENKANNGVAHFLEHMIFKGTEKRSQAQLELEVENMGAYLGAHTSREQTYFYAKCLSSDVAQAVDILADILQNSKFAEKDIERERGVILREMQEIEQNEQEVVMDLLHSVAYMQTPLGQTVLGPTHNVNSITRDDLVNYLKTHYKGPRMVLAGAGGVNHEELCQLGKTHFSKFTTEYDAEIPLDLACRYTGATVDVRDDNMPFMHVAFAVQGVGWNDPDLIDLMVANTFMGTWDKSMGGGSYSSSSLRQGCGLQGKPLSYQAFNICYKDTGLWGVYFVGTRVLSVDVIFNYILDDWTTLCARLTDFEIERAKNALKTNMLLQLNGTTSICEDIGRQMLCHGRRIPINELVKKIEAVDAKSVRNACSRIISCKDPCWSAIGATEGMDSRPLVTLREALNRMGSRVMPYSW